MTYRGELTRAMSWLGQQPNTIFIGQGLFAGTFMSSTFDGVPADKKLEFPVAESFQMQFAMGCAVAGLLPICVFPRQDFMLLALADIVNTLDKLKLGKVIIRTAVGPTKPIYPGVQHAGDYVDAIWRMLPDSDNGVFLLTIPYPDTVFPYYQEAFSDKRSYLMIEKGDEYNSTTD